MSDTPLKDAIGEAIKAAMRARDKERLGALRLVSSELKNIEVNERVDVTDDRVLAVLDKMVKQRRDSIRQYGDAGRDDLVAKEQAEIDVIGEFLPAQLDDEAIAELVSAAIASTGAAGMQDMGKVMGILKPQVQGRADMGAVSAVVKRLLG